MIFSIENVIYAPEAQSLESDGDEYYICSSVRNFKDIVSSFCQSDLTDSQYSELISSLEGSKGLFRPRERVAEELPSDSRVPYINEIEDGIARFDRDQKLGYIVPLDGPQRIRGLAGSGKTVILAMKAALTHLREPKAKICFTFHTKSLYQHVKNLVSRFYRHFDDRDPNWDNFIIQHAWGGRSHQGVYFQACVSHAVRPMTLSDAIKRNSGNPFSYACRSLLSEVQLNPIYDYIFVDEAQDYDESFIYLCLRLAKKNRVIWGADELQNIFQNQSVSYSQVLEIATDANPVESKELSSDSVLKVCYRTPREVLVCAHAMGFGFYGRIVQLLENREHWEDLGYEVESATYIDDKKSEFQLGTEIVISRPASNSPKFSEYDFNIDEVVSASSFETVSKELDAVLGKIRNAINHEKILPSDIVVVCADDRNVGAYFSALSGMLNVNGILVNNVHQDKFGVRDFFEKDRVTLSTIHKAKGNEAYLVFVIGIDAIFFNPGPRERNLVFTAMTRTKGWLSISGMGEPAQRFCAELQSAKDQYPRFKFRLPTDRQLKELKRDISIEVNSEIETELAALQNKLPLDDYEMVLKRKLAEIEKTKNEQKKF
jgi:superfamily I DNA and RNA helicase